MRTLAGAATRPERDLPFIRIRCTDRWVRRARSRTCRRTARRSGRPRSPCTRSETASAMLLGLPPDNVRVDLHARLRLLRPERRRHRVVRRRAAVAGGGAAGPRAVDARKDEMAWENYGLRVRHRRACRRWTRAAASSRGTTSRGLRRSAAGPATTRRATSSPGVLAGRQPRGVRAASAGSGPDRTFNNGSNAAPSYVAGCVGGRCGGTGTIRSERVLTHTVASSFFTGPLRSPARLQNTFAHECFMDEIAAHVKADPVAYRLRHLSDARLIDVVKAAAAGSTVGSAAVTAGRDTLARASSLAVASRCVAVRRRQRVRGDRRRRRGASGHGRGRREAVRHRAGLRPDLESRRHAEPDRGRRAPGHEPRAAARK